MTSDAPPCDVMLFPVHVVKRIQAYARARLRTVYESPSAYVDAGMIVEPRDLEYDDISRAQVRPVDFAAGIGLIVADSGNGDAVAGARPVHEAGAVEAALGRDAAAAVGPAYLAPGGCGYGLPSAVGVRV